ncbi:MAG: urease accessory UreF family protein [Pseudomonadota bacterium]
MDTAAPWATTIAIHMRDADLLMLTQWLSPAYPIGAFAWSHGLESAVARGDVSGAEGLAAWLHDVLTLGAGRSDAILLVAAYEADDPEETAALAAALAPSKERRMETLQQGAAFAATTRDVWGLDLPDMAYPVAVGRAAGLKSLPVLPVTQVWLQGFASNLVQAALRLMPLGQTAGAQILAGLTPTILTIAEEAQAASLDDLGATTFAVDIASMQHADLPSRIFRS